MVSSPSRTSVCLYCELLPFSVIFGRERQEQVLQAINRLPDDIDYRDAADEIAFLAAVREAERDIESGRVITDEQMKARIDEWTGNKVIVSNE